ncbi:MAG: family 16 glycosylhydrolase [Prevotella sp.]
MTKNYFILLFMFIMAVACSGNDDDNNSDDNNGELSCVPQQIEAAAAGGDYTINVKCDRGEWTAVVDDNSNSWIGVTVSGSLSKQGTVTVKVAKNNGTTVRKGNVMVKSGRQWMNIPVIQGLPLQVSATSLQSLSTGETMHVTVISEAEWNVTANEQWLTTSKKTDGIDITTAPNQAMTSRTGTVDVTCGTEKVTITVIQNSAEDKDIIAPDGYKLVWNDEFNIGETLGSDWTHEVQSAGWVNNEQQNYVNHKTSSGSLVTELTDGRLHINCFKENNKIYSGRVYAKVNSGWQYGYMEARIKLPKGKGTWPAFWMMPANNDFGKNPWPGCGEIDIMEEVGVDAGVVSSTIHCNKYNNGGTRTEHGEKYLATAESDFHVYACEWTPSYLRFFVDGESILTYRNDGTGVDAWPFDKPFYIILNLAWGGDWGGYKGVDESALPVTMEVDYVRVFQKK